MKILLTGANGFVGRAVQQCLQTLRGIQIVACVRQSKVTKEDCESSTLAMGNLTAQTDWTHALSGVDAIIHTAARVHIANDTNTDPLVEYRQVNVDATLNLAQQAVKAGVRRFVFISSIKVNGEVTVLGKPFTPDDAPAPVDAYGISKMEAENGLQKLASETGMEVVIIRPPLIYGPGVKANFASLYRAVKRGWPLPLGSIRNKRSLVGLDNLIDFIVTCTINPKAANQIFLVSDGEDLSITELIEHMGQAADVTPRLISIPVRALCIGAELLGKQAAIKRLCSNLQVDISKNREQLGWIPPMSVAEGLRRVEWTPSKNETII